MKIAVIPARGGSKRIPRKNIKSFCGKPILSRAIESAQASACFDYIMVSTDDEEIAAVARLNGANVPFLRPKSLSDDFVTTAPVIAHAIKWITNNIGSVDFACCIYATSPLLQPSNLQKALTALMATEQNFCFSVTSYPYPIQRSIYIRSDDRIEMLYPQHLSTRSQDLEETYHDAGQFYWGRASAWLQEKPILCDRSLPYIVPRYTVQDIDTLEDWERAEYMYKALNLQTGMSETES